MPDCAVIAVGNYALMSRLLQSLEDDLLRLEIRDLAGLITMILLTVTLQVLSTLRLSSTGQSLLPRLDPELLLRL